MLIRLSAQLLQNTDAMAVGPVEAQSRRHSFENIIHFHSEYLHVQGYYRHKYHRTQRIMLY